MVGSLSSIESTRAALARWLPAAVGLADMSEFLLLLPHLELRVNGCPKKNAARFLDLLANLDARRLTQPWDKTACQFELPNPMFLGIERVITQPQPDQNSSRAVPTKKYHVALSFAGEKRPFVRRVASVLQTRLGNERVLYDDEFQSLFARVDLSKHLPALYSAESELICVFLCDDYFEKEWCLLEWTHICQVLATKDQHRVMPLYFGQLPDRPELKILSGSGLLKIGTSKTKTASQVASHILNRLENILTSNPPPIPLDS